MTFPLGRPTNRPEVPDWEPIANRPNWIRHRLNGQERYVEPIKPTGAVGPTGTPGPLGPVCQPGPASPAGDPDEPLYPYVSDEE